MRKKIIFQLLFLFFIANCIEEYGKRNPLFKCNVDKLKILPKKRELIIPSITNNNFKSFAEQTTFKKINIYLDLKNFDYEIEYYKLKGKRELFITGMNKAIETLESLLEVKQVYNFTFSDQDLLDIEINRWDENIIGNKAKKGMADLGIDLFIFIKFANTSELDEGVLAAATPVYWSSLNGQPVLGLVYINRDNNFTNENSLRYFESVILHEFTHVLGFTNYLFQK